MRQLAKVIMIGMALLFSQSVFANAAAEKLKSLLGRITTLSGEFTQTTDNEKQAIASRASGFFKIKRPGLFYWSVLLPNKQLIVINKKKLWLYDKDLLQVTEKELDKTQNVLNPASLLSGQVKDILSGNVVTQFMDHDALIIRLVPKKKDTPFQFIQILFVRDKLYGLQFKNQMGEFTYIRFKGLKENQPIPASVFDFKIPKGVDVVSG